MRSAARQVIPVSLPGEAYEVVVAESSGGPNAFAAHLRSLVPHAHAALVMDERVAAPWGRAIAEALGAEGYTVHACTLRASERAKVMRTVTKLLDRMVHAPLERGSPLIALGGGITGDVAGFAAATFLRGIPLVQVPTTVLAMIDASIGGKTGVNVRFADGTLGKNLVGAFWQPKLVWIDPQVLRTLSVRYRRCGLAEGVKHAVIADAALFERFESESDRLCAGDVDAIGAMVGPCAAIKARIVAADEREAGVRALLNFGHTFAHAIEGVVPRVAHGEAVAIGMVAAARCAEAVGRGAPGTAARLEALLRKLKLPVALRGGPATAHLMAAMGHDKKVLGGRLRLILPERIGAAIIADDVESSAIAASWRSVGAE